MIVKKHINNSFQLFKVNGNSDIYLKIKRPIVISENLRTPENIGAVLRVASNLGAEKVYLINELFHHFKEKKISRTASGAVEKMNWELITQNELAKNLPPEIHIVAIETTPDATNIFEFNFPEKVAFLIGNEVNGISDDLLKNASHRIYIPVPGLISSLNVSHALAVAGFEWLRQMYRQISEK